MQKRKLLRLVGGDDELVGHRREPLDQTTDERSAQNGTVASLWASIWRRLAAGLTTRDTRGRAKLALKKIREPCHIVDIERRDTVYASGFGGQRDVGDHRDRCGRGASC